ncbi:MAG: NYN domain-containing protein [Chloroflexi bacterium]|nr:NYN domain-containing protein [Chloroflexota bacterium]
MNTTRIAIFIDGGYLDVTNRDECFAAKIDYAKLAIKLAGGIDILRTYYYNCLPYQQTPPKVEESKRFAQAQKFHAALRALSRFEVREGMLVYRGSNKKGEAIYVQKGIDIQLGVDLVLLSAKQQISHAAVIAGDSDLIPALCVAKNEGVLIHLYHGASPHRKLIEVADERTLITPGFLSDVLYGK